MGDWERQLFGDFVHGPKYGRNFVGLWDVPAEIILSFLLNILCKTVKI